MKAIEQFHVWAVEYEVEAEGKARILCLILHDPEIYNPERKLPQCILKETDEIITHLLTKPYEIGTFINESNATEVYEVVNPMSLFEYEHKRTNPKS